MSVYNVSVVFNIDEEKIAENLEKDLDRLVRKEIQEKINSVIYNKYSNRTSEPLRIMIKDVIGDILEKNEDKIVNMAAEILADKLSRQKAVKEIAARVASDVLEG